MIHGDQSLWGCVKIRLWHFPICPMMIHSFLHLFHIILLPSFQSLPYPPGPFHCFPCSPIWSISPQVIISPCRFTISSLALFADVPVTPLCDSDDVLLCDTHDYCFVNKSQFNFHTQFVFITFRINIRFLNQNEKRLTTPSHFPQGSQFVEI